MPHNIRINDIKNKEGKMIERKSIAETIQALNNTLLANKAIGNYKHIEKTCLLKLEMLINKIE